VAQAPSKGDHAPTQYVGVCLFYIDMSLRLTRNDACMGKNIGLSVLKTLLKRDQNLQFPS